MIRYEPHSEEADPQGLVSLNDAQRMLNVLPLNTDLAYNAEDFDFIKSSK